LGESRQRISGKKQDRLDREPRDFHRRVEAYYRAAGGPGVRHLDATLPPEQVLRLAWAELRAVRPETFPRLPD
jgi:thymidylate kinase